jgi:hypothetical protein
LQTVATAKQKPLILRWLAGLFGGVLLFFSIPVLTATGSDLPTKLVFAAMLLVVASFLLRYATGIKARWVLIWVMGWFLAFVGVSEIISLARRLSFAQGWSNTLAGVVVGFLIYLLLPLGVKLINAARRASLSKAEAASDDERLPVLYLRSFSVDKRTARIASRASFVSLSFNTHTDEELLAEVLNEIGPCVAVGRPDEWFPPVGFRRIYLGDVSEEVWHDRVLQMIAQARLVVLMGGSSENFTWEARKAIERVKPEHLLILLPRDAKQYEEFASVLKQLLKAPLPEIPKQAALRSKTFRALVYFSPDGTPHFCEPTKLGHFHYPVSQKLTVRVKTALRPVYQQLAIPWEPPPIAWSRVAFYSLQAAYVVLILVLALRQPGP